MSALRHRAAAVLLALCALAACNADGASVPRAYGPTAPPAAAFELDCSAPREGCPCAGNQPPIACTPDAPHDASAATCVEGTRRCHAGRFGACEDVKRFAARPAAALASLVDLGVQHAQCSDCEPNCYSVIDNLDPADGALAAAIASGVAYHGSGAGLTLSSSSPAMPIGPAPAGLPAGALYLPIGEGLTASVGHTASVAAEQTDVYLLLDQSLTMAEETLWLYERFDTGTFLPAGTRCAGADALAFGLGVSGALRCMSLASELGMGMFRDIPFAPYATNQQLPAELRSADAMREVAYRHHAQQSADLAATRAALGLLGGVESSGDPDLAGSQIPALYALATGAGMFMGLGRTSVAAADACPAGRAGYPCFRDGGRPIVVLVTDAPFHNGPNASSLAYDYDPAALSTTAGTVPDATPVPDDNDTWTSAFELAGDLTSSLAVYEGSTAALDGSIAAAAVSCGATSASPNAVFRFDVPTAGRVRLSTEGTSFGTALAVFTGPAADVDHGVSDDGNEQFSSAHDLGDVAGRHVQRDGDSGDPRMESDYQGSLFGRSCGANTLAADAVYRFGVGATAQPAELEVSLAMGGQRPVLAIYEQGAGVLPRWPARTTALVATGNRDAHAENVYTLPSGAGNEYVSVRGDTTELGADFDDAVLGGAMCSPQDAALDAAFRIHVDGTRRLRFDTEGSSFDTVLSLHDAPPLTDSDSMRVWSAAETHQNLNEDGASAYETGPVDGLRQIFEGDTSGMRADVNDTFGCGMDGGCGDAVYAIEVTQRTTLRLSVSGTGYEPAVVVTRADPEGVSGRHAPFALGEQHTCALSGGRAYCWGLDYEGQLGDGGGADDGFAIAPVQVATVTDIVQIAAGVHTTCGVTSSGALYCWGEGNSGQVGDGAAQDRRAPAQVTGVGGSGTFSNAVQAACGRRHCCALRGDGSVACFGDNAAGQLGDGTTASRVTPVLVAGGHVFEQLAANADHTCAIRAGDDAVLCWGGGAFGKMGDGAFSNNLSPAPVTGVTGATHVIAGQEHNCAVLASGRVSCWGRGAEGRLGQGSDAADHSTPVSVRNYDGSGLLANVKGGWAGGRAHTCVTTLEGFVLCWGDNGLHQLGNAGTSAARYPTGVHGLLDAVQVAGSHDHTCALRAQGDLMCWGHGAHAKLGNGSQDDAPVPARTHPGAPHVSFGNGALDAAFTAACRSLAQPPEPGCERGALAGETYYFCNAHARTFAGAAQVCAAAGYELVDIDEPGENAYVASQLDGPAWIGVKRESSADWLDLSDDLDFENLAGEEVWHTEVVGHDRCTWSACEWQPTEGFFTSEAAPDLVDNAPFTSSSTWANDEEPGTDHGHNCVTLRPDGKWQTDNCSALRDETDCGFLGLGCLLRFIGNLIGGLLDWIVPWVGDLVRLIFDSIGGIFAAPHFAGGVERDYVCEERERTTDVALDPGRYYIAVKGIDDGDDENACEGPYRLQVDDLGSPTGGFIACDDNGVAETTSSAIERTLTTGDYYLVVKGKRSTDSGPYQLTVRDLSAVETTEIACDAGAGSGDPARVTFTAEPGRDYYALVKGDAPSDSGPYSFEVRDLAGGDAVRVACDAQSGQDGSSLLELDLDDGSYYAVLKGRGANQAGDYRLSVGSAAPIASSFTSPTYDETVAALAERDIRVATVLSCVPGAQSCEDAYAQAQELASDTGGIVRRAQDASLVPAEIVQTVHILEALDRVRGELLFSPSLNPGFVNPGVFAVPAPNNQCSAGEGLSSFRDCRPGATPTFLVSLTNPPLLPVLPLPDPLGLQFTLRVTGERAGEVVMQEDVPVIVAPAVPTPAGSYTRGVYEQDFGATACERSNQRPLWHALGFDADVRPDTRLGFYACAANSMDALDGCDAGTPTSGYRRVVTVTAGSDTGTACSVQTQAADCPNGYCSPYTSVCNELEGATCSEDRDCPGSGAGRCRIGASASLLGRTCRVNSLLADPSSALDEYNLLPFLRVRLELESLGERARAPSVFFWESRYTCRDVE